MKLLSFLLVLAFCFGLNQNILAQEELNFEDVENIETDTIVPFYTGWMIELKASPLFTFNSYTKTQYESYTHEVSPNNMYDPQMSVISHLGLAYYGKNWGIHSGLSYFPLKENFVVYESNSKLVGVDSLTTIDRIKGVNTYNYLSIPLTVSYVIYLKRFQIDLRAGLQFNVSVSKDGLTYDFKEKKVIDLADNYQAFQAALAIGMGLRYVVKDNFFIVVDPFYITGINSIWKDSPIYAWKRSHIGAMVGIAYGFSPKALK
ncbi:MAG: hypothetical protein JXR60_03315 [Bacteroidales bacterium]|nr:hypothetical protein [Bacteroidales bacterium]